MDGGFPICEGLRKRVTGQSIEERRAPDFETWITVFFAMVAPGLVRPAAAEHRHQR